MSYSPKELGSIIEKVAGKDASMHFLYDPENESEPIFSEESDVMGRACGHAGREGGQWLCWQVVEVGGSNSIAC